MLQHPQQSPVFPGMLGLRAYSLPGFRGGMRGITPLKTINTCNKMHGHSMTCSVEAYECTIQTCLDSLCFQQCSSSFCRPRVKRTSRDRFGLSGVDSVDRAVSRTQVFAKIMLGPCDSNVQETESLATRVRRLRGMLMCGFAVSKHAPTPCAQSAWSTLTR